MAITEILRATKRLPIEHLENLGEIHDGEPVECDVFESEKPYPLNEADFYDDAE